MAAQGEREPGVVGSSSNVLDPMAQKTPMQEQISPEMDPKLEMGAAAAAADFATPPLLSQIPPPPVPSKNAHHNGGSRQLTSLEAKQLMEAIQGVINGLRTQRDEIRAWGKERRGETRQMGHGLQAG